MKEIKLKYINIKNIDIIMKDNEIFLKKKFIECGKYKESRDIKLLLKKNELKTIFKEKKKYKVIPLNFLIKKGIIKINIALTIKK